MIDGLTYGAIVIVAGIVWMLISHFRLSNRPNKRVRSMSFGSQSLADGVFPANVNAWKTIIDSAMYFRSCPSVADLVKKCQILTINDRFRCALQTSGGKTYLVDITDSLDIEKDAIRTVNVESESELITKIDEICAEDMVVDGKSPIWCFYRLVNHGEGKSAILVRIHHVIGDGVALLSLLPSFFEDANGDPFKLDIAENMGGGTNSRINFSVVWGWIKSVIQVAGLPHSNYDSNLAFTTQNKPAINMTDKKRRTVLFPVLKLEFIKAIKNKAGVTVNDVMMSCITGAIRRYSILKKDPLVSPNLVDIDSTAATTTTAKSTIYPTLQSRALLAVAFPRSKKELQNPATSLRNLFAVVSVPLPINGTTALNRLQQCAVHTRQLKSSPLALVQLFMQNYVLSYAPLFLTRQIAHDVFSRHTMVCYCF